MRFNICVNDHQKSYYIVMLQKRDLIYGQVITRKVFITVQHKN